MTADKLREAIFTMHFKPNDRLVERDLCDQTGVSRTCVREALRHLESEGLVERRSNKGLYVTAITPVEAQQIYEVRGALEPVLARLLSSGRAMPTSRRLRQAVSHIGSAVSGKPVRAYVQALKSSMPSSCGERQ
jgi:DNA-binding GntR family transcriptional regulator